MRYRLIAAALVCMACAAQAQEARQVEGVSIIGNNELPQSIIIVPWKRDEVGSTPNLPKQSLMDERFPRIDRKALVRNVQFYQSLQVEE
ncbi:MAG: hypothetical protein ACQES2_09375 [Pseudomonadota bacterium]